MRRSRVRFPSWAPWVVDPSHRLSLTQFASRQAEMAVPVGTPPSTRPAWPPASAKRGSEREARPDHQGRGVLLQALSGDSYGISNDGGGSPVCMVGANVSIDLVLRRIRLCSL